MVMAIYFNYSNCNSSLMFVQLENTSDKVLLTIPWFQFSDALLVLSVIS